MLKLTTLLIASVAILLGQNADLKIQAKVGASTLTIQTSARMAGAIDSITWRGKEFLNTYDHGRELQSASSFDGYGECLNPTEAGSDHDGPGATSSSRLVESRSDGKTLETTIEMAYWLQPGTKYHRACGSHKDWQEARNATVRSTDTLHKKVTIGLRGMPNVLDYDMTFNVTEDHQSATFEAATAYMPPEFSEFLVFNTATHRTEPLSDGPGEQAMPVILATPDHEYAMGIYSPGLPQAAFPRAGYGRWRFLQNPKIPGWNTVKWNAVYRVSPAPKGSYRYRCYVAIGTLKDVSDAIDRMAQSRMP